MLIRMLNVKSVKVSDDRKLYQHQMLLSEDRFELQSIEADQEDDQKADQDLTQILLKSDSESDSDSEHELNVNENLIKEMISIQNQIIVENQMNQLCFNIQIIMKQNSRTCQDIDLDCYDSSYASSLMTMLMTMLMTILRAIVDRSSLEHRLVSKSTLFRVSLCSSESYR